MCLHRPRRSIPGALRPVALRAAIVAGLMLLGSGASDACAQAPLLGPVALSPVANGPTIFLADLRGSVHVVMFWRSDCAPCLIELHNYAALSQAAHGELITVALEPKLGARAALARFSVPEADAFTAEGDAQATLEAVSDGGRRLPLSIALDPEGRLCARHVGLLGTERARAWISRCSR